MNAREVLHSLERRQALLEIADPLELRRAAVEHYLEESRKLSRMPERAAAGEKQQVLLVTTINEVRRDLNREIRKARVAGREIEEGRSLPVLAPVRQGITVEGCQLWDTLHFSGERTEDGRTVAWGARLHAEGKVVGLDRERNRVRIDLKTYRHVDHAYALTIQKSQGATVEHSILCAPVHRKKGLELEPGSEFEESCERMSYNAFNVAVTRARFTTRVFTNSIEDLERSVESVDRKSSTLDKAREPVREITCAQQREITEPACDRQRSIRDLERVMLKRVDGRRAPSLEHVVPLVRAPALRIPEQELQVRQEQKVVVRQLELSLTKLPGMGIKM